METHIQHSLRALRVYYDIIIFSETMDDHTRHVTQILEALEKNGLHLKPAKKSHPSGTHGFFGKHGPWKDWTEFGLNDLADTELNATDADTSSILRVDDTQKSNVTTAIELENDRDTTIQLACQPAKTGTSVSDPIGDNHDASIDAIGEPETPAAVTQHSDEPLEHDVTGDHTTPDNPSFSLTKESNGLELGTQVELEHAKDPIEEFRHLQRQILSPVTIRIVHRKTTPRAVNINMFLKCLHE
ncbi:hypothetical protein F5884DRAFT_808810 [Xylogone sp. PMI_703]|nr:hypothetical protein F5884DRAFT_808810 [Xylogone sp. PMI_703]